MIDLMSIARTEADGGDLFGKPALCEPTEVRPDGHPEAVVWSGGNFVGNVNPVAHSLTDAYARWGLWRDRHSRPSFYTVPMWSQYRHDTKLECPAGLAICHVHPLSGQLLAMPM